jgi:hypothetical protein
LTLAERKPSRQCLSKAETRVLAFSVALATKKTATPITNGALRVNCNTFQAVSPTTSFIVPAQPGAKRSYHRVKVQP